LLFVATSAIEPPGISLLDVWIIYSSPVKRVAAYIVAIVPGTGGYVMASTPSLEIHLSFGAAKKINE
jgi:hypothetical protein